MTTPLIDPVMIRLAACARGEHDGDVGCGWCGKALKLIGLRLNLDRIVKNRK